jgi:hypothetical protein
MGMTVRSPCRLCLTETDITCPLEAEMEYVLLVPYEIPSAISR